MSKRYLLGFDVGSSSVKASLVDADTGACAASAFFPDSEAPIKALKAGWAEQEPESWWNYAKMSLKKIMADTGAKGEDIKAIGEKIEQKVAEVEENLKVADDDIEPCSKEERWASEDVYAVMKDGRKTSIKNFDNLVAYFQIYLLLFQMYFD